MVDFLVLKVKLIIDIFGVGIWNVILVSFFFKCGKIRVIVFVVLVVVGIIFWVVLCLFLKFFLLGLFIVGWVVVIVWIVVIRFLVKLKLLLIILVIGVK